MPRQLFLAANYQENGTEFSLLFRNFTHLFEQNRGTKMLTEKFFEVIRNEGVVSIVSWGACRTPLDMHLEQLFGGDG